MRGPHDFRHTFSTWLEDAGIPARVIDELMGHQRSRHGELDGGSRIGARYRHTTDQMAARVVDAIEARLQMVLRAGEDLSLASLLLHLPAGWPWAAWFDLALARLRCVAYAT